LLLILIVIDINCLVCQGKDLGPGRLPMRSNCETLRFGAVNRRPVRYGAVRYGTVR
jgi:hypothetical protein